MESFNKFFEDWYLVLFGLMFWVSIFVAAVSYTLLTLPTILLL